MGDKPNGRGRRDVIDSPAVSTNDLNQVHDFLSTILEDEGIVIGLGLTPGDIHSLTVARGVLCWILGHENHMFIEGVIDLEMRLKAMDNTSMTAH